MENENETHNETYNDIDIESRGLSDYLEEDEETGESAVESGGEADEPEESEPEEDTDEEYVEDVDDDEDDDDDEDRSFEIDDALKSKLDEESLKRLENHLKGAEKAWKKYQEAKSRYEAVDTYMEAFQHPEQAGFALQQLADNVAAMHGMTADQLLGHSSGGEDYTRAGDDKVERLQKEIQELKMRQQAYDYLRTAVPKVRGFLKQNYPSITVSSKELEAQVADAVARFPELAEKPEKAWVKTHGELIAKAKVQRAPRVRPMAKSVRSGNAPKDISSKTFMDYLKEYE